MLTKGVTREKLSSCSVSVGLQDWRWRWEICQVQEGSKSNIYSSSGVVEISLQVGDCWLWSLIIFLMQRSFAFSRVYTPWSIYTPEVCTLFHAGECRGGVPPLWGPGGLSPWLGGLGERCPPMGDLGWSPQRKNCLVNVYCNFIVNLDWSFKGRISNDRDYVRVFFPRRKPSFMREVYCKYGWWWILYSEREDCERKKRKLQWVLL